MNFLKFLYSTERDNITFVNEVRVMNMGSSQNSVPFKFDHILEFKDQADVQLKEY